MDDGIMAAASVVYEGVRTTPGTIRGLFQGQSFWFSNAVPQRKWLIENAVANGATIVPLEKQADVLIVDHARKNAPVGTHSYKYIEQSIRNGQLEDLADHVVGPASRTDRAVGCMTTAPKGSRSKYTEAEDQLLWNFVKPYEHAGGATGGNEIYKQLEEAHGNGRHTYQSWRDRWLKHVKFQNRQITESVYADDAEVVSGLQAVPEASPQQQTRKSTQPSASTPLGKPERTQSPRSLTDQTRVAAEPSSHDDAFTIRARESLQRKLGRVLPSTPSTLDGQQWEPVSQHRPQHRSETEVVRVQRGNPGLSTLLTETDGLTPELSAQSSQAAVRGSQEDAPKQTSQLNAEVFTDEEYKLLLDAAEYIISEGEGVDDGSWERMAENYPAHSAVSWREFWVGKVKPDHEMRTTKIKEEQASQDADVHRPGTDSVVQEENKQAPIESSSGDLEFWPLPTREEDGIDEPEAAIDETAEHEPAEGKALQEDEGAKSHFESQVSSVSSHNTSPYTCKWHGCDTQLSNLHMLTQHLASAHKPSPKVVEDEGGWTCRWRGCQNVQVDVLGNDNVLNLQTRKEWVQHYVDEHMNPIITKHGLGPSIDQVHRARSQSFQRNLGTAPADDQASVTEVDDDEISVASPSQLRKSDHGYKREQNETEEFDEGSQDEDSEEAQETESSSSSMQDAEINDPGSDKDEENDDYDRDSSQPPRRSQRLRDMPQPAQIKDLGFSYVDKAVGSSPPLPAQNTTGDLDSRKSPAFQPLSPAFAKPPESNEARKRSASKGTNSQESSNSQPKNFEVIETQLHEIKRPIIMSSPRKRSREPELLASARKLPGFVTNLDEERTNKRKKQQYNDHESLEIPSTPEHQSLLGELRDDGDGDGHDEDVDEGSSMLNGSPTPRPRMKQIHKQTLVATPSQDRGPSLERPELRLKNIEHTSPRHISMVSDTDVEIASNSSSHSTSTILEDLSSEPDLQFETAPDTADLWGTAPSEEMHEEASEDVQFETAPEPRDRGRDSERERADTQSLFAHSIPDITLEVDDPFALPEPNGGWPDEMEEPDGLGEPLAELLIPASHQPPTANEEDDTDDNDDAASVPSDVPGWISEQTTDDPRLNVKTLLRAIQVTSGSSKSLVIDVHDFIVSTKTEPRHMRGCWTEQDDRALHGSNRKETARVLRKHGRAAVDRRRWWLSEGAEE